MPRQPRFVSYIRVSTDRQQRSGLGLEAQVASVTQYAESVGGTIIGSFVETESGKRADNRPELIAALKLAKRERATLLIATLDRLSRSVCFISGLLESHVPFVCADRPNAAAFELHIFAAMSCEERRRIAERTKAALAAKRAQGAKLGRSDIAVLNNERIAERAAHRALVGPVVQQLRADGMTYLQVAEELNRRNIPTAQKGARWHDATVFALAKKLQPV